eukprot:TRINITY_DN0_c2777_g1_i2.p1 TRINITY_DN0_c2777_g1~~TRINITY_DN0_c2777_g1_i2.p1  ORF type:complete len:106 (-),score=24.25 TRINITY_DN0_c2777_g1_i2:29-346(-)
MEYLVKFWNSPVGPKTTHFWGPVMNWGFVVQGIIDRDRPAERLSRNMQAVLSVYSLLFMRFAYRVQPRNWLLFGMHFTNFWLQFRLFARRMKYEMDLKKKSLPSA